jgi:hypothetical protein
MLPQFIPKVPATRYNFGEGINGVSDSLSGARITIRPRNTFLHSFKLIIYDRPFISIPISCNLRFATVLQNKYFYECSHLFLKVLKTAVLTLANLVRVSLKQFTFCSPTLCN